MQGTVKVGNKDIEMAANGLTPIIFKKVTGQDIVAMIQDKDGVAKIMEHADKLGYIMATQAKDSKALMMKFDEADYYQWLTQFDPMDLTVGAADIVNFYMGDLKTDSEPKKKQDQPKGK